MTTSRRQFLGAAAAAGLSSNAFAQTLKRALATPAYNASGSIADVAHVVFLMQENRSFDSYFGTLAGVRGFSDPRCIALPSGQPVWAQPDASGKATVLPYHFDIRNTRALRVGLDHSWKGSEATWKDWNAWVKRKSPRTMGFFNRADLPFYHALADAFTVCDDYHCSIFGPTDPNRFYALSGQAPGNLTGIQDSRLYNVTNGIYNGDIANDNPAAQGIAWRSYAELLQEQGISWKVYQEWDNYGDNYLQYFRNFRVDAQGRPLTSASPLYQRGRAFAPGSTAANAPGTSGQWLIDDFARDVREGTLPAVSWICAPTEYCEHPEATPNAGENFTARLLAALVAKPEVWARTVLVITYDENDGFFDHIPSVMPALNASRGRSTLARATEGEVFNGEPVGLGPRVPTMLISPWTKGGRVCSQLFDHSSLLRFLEEWLVQGRGLPRAAVQCEGISPWRRAVCGDLTSAFDFKTPDTRFPNGVPAQAVYFKDWGTADALPPAQQSLPSQERVQGSTPRSAAALPYRMSVDGAGVANASQFALSFANKGQATASFIVYSTLRSDGPWHYSVEPGQNISNEVWNWTNGAYALAVHSHNGWLREFRGSFAGLRGVEVTLTEEAASASVTLNFVNSSAAAVRLRLADGSYGDKSVQIIDLAAGQSRSLSRALGSSFGWYDLIVSADSDASYQRRFSGHLEGAGLNYTDPVLNGLASSRWDTPPVLTPVPPASAKLSASSDRIRTDQTLTLQWSGLPAGNKHWIGVYRKGWVPGSQSSLKWNYVASAAGSQTLSGLGEGEYFIGLFLNDGYEEAAPRVNLRVLKPGDVNGDGSISAADRDALRNAVGSCAGEARYEPLADFDGDRCVTQADYRAWYAKYGSKL